MKILILEDAVSLAEAVVDHLNLHNHVVDHFTHIEDAETALLTMSYDVVLLDLNLPDGSGISLLKKMRANGAKNPVLILTARDQIRDRIAGLDAGADDYIVKPFDLDELVARIKSVARRSQLLPDESRPLGDCVIDVKNRTVERGNDSVALTRKEWILLELLLRRPGNIVERTTLENALYSFDEDIESNALEVHISRMRTKLGRSVIKTHRGLGYSV
ncbi:transcriptional regulator [Ruegeria sp. ANG-R]|uniref:response regulator transcription factor n=1 Tax=Ruegeria sp. ANG-R TaxID=1577903 RepID=UPI0005805C96|nr:response regulator transcription factor [Ruegeria sp. ANG-R]KIC35698.1 transcriptional regulator [Ruegeria sp. ANG-R]